MKVKRSAVVDEALTWLETPYHNHGRVKGVGVDCLQILLGVYVDALKMRPPIDIDNYAPQWHLHRSEELYLQGLESAGALPVQSPALGDIALFKFGRTFSHAAIVVEEGADPLMLHAYIGAGVIRTRGSEFPLSGRPVRYFTLSELEA